MVEILEFLVQVFCPRPETVNVCWDFMNAPHHQVLEPLGPLFYFLLFPSVFILIFIYILTGSLLRGMGGLRGGLKILVSVTVYIFVVISGLYAVVLPLSEMWYIAIIILFGLWYLITRHFGGGGGVPAQGGGAGRMPEAAGVISGIRGHVVKVKDSRREIEGAISNVENAIRLTKSIKAGKSERPADDSREIRDIRDMARTVLAKYEAKPINELSGKVDDLRKKLHKLEDESRGI